MDFIRNIISSFHKPNIIKSVKVPNKKTGTSDDTLDKVTNINKDKNNKKKGDKNKMHDDGTVRKNIKLTDSEIDKVDNMAEIDINNLSDEKSNVHNNNNTSTEMTNLKNKDNKKMHIENDLKKFTVKEITPNFKDIPLNKIDSIDVESLLKTTVIIGDVVMTNEIDAIATKYLKEFEEMEIIHEFERTKTNLKEFDEIINKEVETIHDKLEVNETEKCLKEFDKVLAKLKVNSELGLKQVTLDDFDDILDLDDDAYNFQEIKFNKNINNEQTLNKDEDDLDDIISISSDSDDGKTEINVDKIKDNFKLNKCSTLNITDKNKNKVENGVIQIEINDNGCKINDNLKLHKATTSNETKSKAEDDNKIEKNDDDDDHSIDSDDDNEYHSSDFEFITEEEAKMDGFIINFNAERHLNNNNDDDDSNGDENYEIPERVKLFEGHQALPISEIRYLENKCIEPRAPMYVQHDAIGFNVNMHEDSNEEYRDEAEETKKKIIEMYQENRIKRRRRI